MPRNMTTERRVAPQVGDIAAPMVRIELLGGFRVSVGNRAISEDAWRLRKAATVVKLLAITSGHRLHREQVIDQLWPDLDLKAAANNLHHVLHVARRILDPPATLRPLQLRDGLLQLVPEGRLWLDVEVFEAAVAAARLSHDPASYRSALALYRGDLLPEDLYEEWAGDRRESLRTLYLAFLIELAEECVRRGEPVQAIDAYNQAVRADPTLEEAHVGLMRLYARAGQRHQALRQYEQLRQALEQELDVEPDPETQQLHQAILSGRLSVDAALPAPVAAESVRRHNLPASLTSFVGREAQIAEIRGLMGATRFLTVVGPGGAGKTRLALQVAGQLLDSFPDGVWLVELAPLEHPAHVTRAVADALSIPEATDRPLIEVLADALSDRQLLLVLDNCEHLVEACGLLVQSLLATCPRLRVLATSRETLGVTGEVTVAVPPLSLPDPGRREAIEALQETESIRLFTERARARHPAFALTEQNASAVVQICRRLAGIPLAIELAAARIGVLSPQQIADRLTDALSLLTSGSRTATPRQQTLRGALDWSYALLDEPDQRLFARLAVFAGGCTLEAAEAIGEGNDVLEGLSRLVDKSLVVAETGGPAVRYRLLEPIRQYATERLEAGGDADAIHHRHASLFLALADEARSNFTGPEQAMWLERLEHEYDNLRTALRWSMQHDPVLGLRLVGRLIWFWYVRGHLREGRAWLEGMLAHGEGAPDAERAKAYQGAGALAYAQRDYEAAESYSTEALRLHRQVGDQRELALSLGNLALVAFEKRDYERATRLHEETLAIRREIGDRRGISASLRSLAAVIHDRGDAEGAVALFEEGLAIDRELGDTVSIAVALNNLAEIADEKGDYDRSAELCRQGLPLAMEVGLQEVVASLLERLGSAAVNQGHAARAAHLYSAAAAVREVIGAPIQPREMPEHQRRLDALRETLEESFEALWSEGQSLSTAEAVAYALQEDESDAQPVPAAPDALSLREREVAHLIARGLTNRQIGDELGIAPRTVDTHVAKILSKLQLSSRSQVAVQVAQSRL